MSNKTKVIAGAMLVIVIALFFIFRPSSSTEKEQKPQGNTQQSNVIAADAYIVKARNIENEIRSTGSILPNESVEIRSEVSRKLTGIHFKEGAYVRKGQVLFTLDNSDLYARLRKLEIQRDLAARTLGRDSALIQRGLISQEQSEISEGQLQQINADIEVQEVDISKTSIRAPFSGYVGLRNVSLGGYVSPQNVLTTLQDISNVKVDFTIPEKYAQAFRIGQTIKFKIAASNEEFTGQVYAAEPFIDQGTRSMRLRAVCNNPGGKLNPGTFVEVNLALDNIADAVMIPTQSLVPKLKGQSIYVVRNGEAKLIDVELGLRTDTDVQVFSGEIKEGDTVITTNILRLSNGSKVKIIKAE